MDYGDNYGTIRGMIRRLIPAILWLILIYVITALAEDLPPPPDNLLARLLDEGRHVLAHSFVYGVQMLLLIRAVGYPGRSVREARPLLAMIVMLGVGQEVLQVLMRHKIQWVGTPWDLTVDVTGAIVALRLHPMLVRWSGLRWLKPGSLAPGNELPS